MSLDIIRRTIQKQERDGAASPKTMRGEGGGVERSIAKVKTQTLGSRRRRKGGCHDNLARARVEGAEEVAVYDINSSIFTMAHVNINGANRTEVGILRD